MSAWDKNNVTGQRCILELPLKYTKSQHDLLDKVFRVSNDMKNCLIGWYSRQLTEMTRTRRWQEIQHDLAELHREYDQDLAKLEKPDATIKLEEEHCAKFGTPFKLSNKKAKQRAELAARTKEYKDKERPLIVARSQLPPPIEAGACNCPVVRAPLERLLPLADIAACEWRYIVGRLTGRPLRARYAHPQLHLVLR